MANNIAREYIDFSKKNITKYLKIILDKYYAKKIVDPLLEVYINVRYYNNEDIKIQRDLYSSYLIKNVNMDLKTINNDKCIEGFEKFLEYHNIEIERLQGLNNVSSIGV